MVRIIPWNLPPVKGGSIGGYTPDSGGSDPTPSATYIDFTDIVAELLYTNFGTFFTISNGNSQEITVTSLSGSGTSLDGAVVDTLVGVSNVKVAVDFETTYNNCTSISKGLVFDLDPLSMALTVNSGKVEITNNSGSTTQIASFPLYVPNDPLYTTTTYKMTFYVYNGNGEVIREQEVTLV